MRKYLCRCLAFGVVLAFAAGACGSVATKNSDASGSGGGGGASGGAGGGVGGGTGIVLRGRIESVAPGAASTVPNVVLARSALTYPIASSCNQSVCISGGITP
jgi:hypothetical protein